jgi:hypothetical protein
MPAGRSVLPRIALIAAVLAPLAAAAGELRVVGPDGGALLALPVEDGDRWCLVWNHSVTGDEVRDCFRAADGRMLLERSRQRDFAAAGLGQIPGRGEVVPDGDGGYWIERIDMAIPSAGLPLRVGSMRVDHRLAAGGRVVSLSALAAGRRVTLRLVEDARAGLERP